MAVCSVQAAFPSITNKRLTHMSFNLSLAKKEVEDNPELVKASTTYPEKVDPMTGRKYEQNVTDGGVTIDKSKAPALVLDGPVGYQVTELLDRVLSKESMSALLAAYEDDSADAKTGDAQHSGDPTGTVDVNLNTGAAVNSSVQAGAGYLYVADVDKLGSGDVVSVLNRLDQVKRENPDAEVSLALVGSGAITPTVESLMSNAHRFGVRVSATKHGINAMVADMLKKAQ